MPLSTRDPFEDNSQHLRTFPDHVLLDIARNDAAQKPYRLLAVEILQVRKSPLIKHPDIQFLVSELEIELDGIVFEHPAPSGPGPLTSSITTATMFADGPVIENESSDSLSEVIEIVPTTDPSPVPSEPEKPHTRKPKEPVDAS
jgi:hypothetical protein